MKQFTKSIGVALLTLAMSFNALADGGRYERHRYDGHASGPGWLAPLLFLGVAGAIISSADRAPAPQVYVSPPVTYAPVTPIYVTPPVVVSAPPPVPNNFWYFCRSVGQYYPYIPSCPEGWQRVSPTPQ